MEVVQIALERLGTRADARKVDESIVRGLVGSISELGIVHPLRVRPVRAMVNGVEDDAFEVIAGGHRLRAARRCHLETAPCVVVDDNDLLAELAMIDENLCRAELSPAERSLYGKRRKAIYLDLHPETKHGGARASGQVGHLDNVVSFAADAAEKTGKSERSVRRDAERGEGIADDVLALVAHTHLDSGAYLDRLKGLDPDAQRTRVAKALADPTPTKPAKRALSDAEAVEKQFQAIVAAWNRAGPEARDQFKAEYIDTPVMSEKWG